MKRRSTPGSVALVGAGPGDPGLLTERGARLLRAADVVLFDRLTDPRLLTHCVNPGVRRVYVGKEKPGSRNRDREQRRIFALMASHARAGRNVVRLKGGDPYIFGRGGEEGLYLAARGIPFQVVPGVTAALGAAATTGIPFTHRGISQEVTFATAHAARGGEAPSWSALGKLRGTVVFYMGTYTLADAARKLVAAGRRPTTPVAVVERATTARQRTFTGTLATIARIAADAGVRPPSLVIVGDAVALRPRLDWFAARPLFGRRVLVCRPAGVAGPTVHALDDAGAETTLLPCLEFRPPAAWRAVDRALRSLRTRDWIVLSSAQGVSAVAGRLGKLGLDARAFGDARIAVIGDATARILPALLGLRADLVPRRATAEGLVAALGPKRIRGRSFLLLRADAGRDALPALLHAAGARVADIACYRSVPARPDRTALAALAAGAFDAVLLTSGESARVLHRWLGRRPWPARTRLLTIGPVTSAAVRALGWRVDREAASPSRLVHTAIEALSRP